MNYVESIEKQASQAWKRHFADLGEESIKRLKNSGVFDRAKELSGLERGTNNILNNLGYTMSSDKRLAKRVAKSSYDNYGEKMRAFTNDSQNKLIHKNSLTDRFMRRRDMSDVANGVGTTFNDMNFIYVPKDASDRIHKSLKRTEKSTLGKLSGIKAPSEMSDFEKRYANAIIKRHEADEARASVALKNKGLNNVANSTNYFSHVTPEVMDRESANLSLAPKKTRDLMKNVRMVSGEYNDFYDKSKYKDLNDFIKAYDGGVELTNLYGKSPVYKKRRLAGIKRLDQSTGKEIADMSDRYRDALSKDDKSIKGKLLSKII